MREILESIEEKLSEVSELKYIAPDCGQLKETVPSVQFPCCLLAVTNVDYADRMNGEQRVVATLDIVLADHLQISPAGAVSNPFYIIFDLIDSVAVKLNTHLSQYHTPLTRVKLEKQLRNDDIQQYTIRYTFSYVEQLSEPITYIRATPVITVQ